jgi:cobalt/nickel transport system ATP-binding protein
MPFSLERLTYRYEGVTALDDLTLAIPEGTRVALLGANGSGKSTLLRLLDGLIFGQSGAIWFRGEEISEEHMLDDAFALPFRRTVGIVFQNPDVQLFNPTVFDEVAFSPLQLRWPKNEVRDRVNEMLDRLRIGHLKNRIPQRLSGGEKKRVALASVLVIDPAVLLLDEPTAALDPRSQSEIIDLMVEWGGGSKSVITATHDLSDLADIADRCFVLDNGKLAAEGAPSEILDNSELLRRTNLIHAHRHRHALGEIHSHPHLHGKLSPY